MNTDLATVIKQIVENAWADNKSIVLLSDLEPLIKAEIKEDYRAHTGGLGLYKFVQTALKGVVDTRRHPTQSPKIALFPHGENYEFDAVPSTDLAAETKPSTTLRNPKDSRKAKSKLEQLLKIFSELSEEDAKEVHIPFHILLKLSR